jgi:hypothetical protein
VHPGLKCGADLLSDYTRGCVVCWLCVGWRCCCRGPSPATRSSPGRYKWNVPRHVWVRVACTHMHNQSSYFTHAPSLPRSAVEGKGGGGVGALTTVGVPSPGRRFHYPHPTPTHPSLPTHIPTPPPPPLTLDIGHDLPLHCSPGQRRDGRPWAAPRPRARSRT